MEQKHVNILIVGAGLSGIGAAYHIEKESPQVRLRYDDNGFPIQTLEGRETCC